MKGIKYLMIAGIAALVLTSCDKKEVEGPWDIVTQQQAQVQILYETPVASAAANYIYTMVLGTDSIYNNGAALISNYNGTPGGSTGLFYTVKAGENALKLLLKNGTVVYDKKFTVEAGHKYQVYVPEYDKDPIVIDSGTIPLLVTTNTAEYFAVRLVNMMWETPLQRPDYKLQLRIQNDQSKEYEPWGKPVAFGEATEWLTPPLHKTTFNSSGSQRINLDLVMIDASGKELGRMKYTKSTGAEAEFTDYWTETIGRGYVWILHGTRGDKVAPVAISQWTLR